MPIESIIARKSLGVLMHPTCIPGGRVCGTFGRGAKEWIKKLHEHGIEYWQFLPLTPTDSTGSPYSSPSSFALNPWFLDIDDLIEKGFIFISNKENMMSDLFDTKQEAEEAASKYGCVGAHKMGNKWMSCKMH